MRLLSDQELDEVLGGGDRVSVTTLPTLTVNGTFAANQGQVWSAGAVGLGPVQGPESGQAPCYMTYYSSLMQLPSFAHLRCIAAHTNVPGFELLTNVDMVILNNYVTGAPDAVTGVDTTHLHVTVSRTYNQSELELNGQYMVTSNYKAVTLTAAAFVPYAAPTSYINPTNLQPGSYTAGLSAEEHVTFVMGHESAHEHGVHDELQANWYGVQAVQNLHSLPAGTCP